MTNVETSIQISRDLHERLKSAAKSRGIFLRHFSETLLGRALDKLDPSVELAVPELTPTLDAAVLDAAPPAVADPPTPSSSADPASGAALSPDGCRRCGADGRELGSLTCRDCSDYRPVWQGSKISGWERKRVGM